MSDAFTNFSISPNDAALAGAGLAREAMSARHAEAWAP
jgi:hypothetical protein